VSGPPALGARVIVQDDWRLTADASLRWQISARLRSASGLEAIEGLPS